MSQNLEGLRQQILVNNFVMAAGCNEEQARMLLQASQWQFQTALSVFFQEAAIPPCRNCNGSHTSFQKMCTPQNTPATPPNFPETLMNFSKLSTMDNSSGSNPTNHARYATSPQACLQMAPPSQLSQSPAGSVPIHQQ